MEKKIPEEIAVASFSGTELSNIVYPKLTTVEPPLYQMGKKAAELILEKIKDPASPNHSIVLDAEIKCVHRRHVWRYINDLSTRYYILILS